MIVRGCQGQTGGQIRKWASLINVFAGLNRQFFCSFMYEQAVLFVKTIIGHSTYM